MSVDPGRVMGGEGKSTADGGDRMEVDSRGNARGQSEEQIRKQQQRVQETSRGLWGSKT